jgi:hypothetical protein
LTPSDANPKITSHLLFTHFFLQPICKYSLFQFPDYSFHVSIELMPLLFSILRFDANVRPLDSFMAKNVRDENKAFCSGDLLIWLRHLIYSGSMVFCHLREKCKIWTLGPWEWRKRANLANVSIFTPLNLIPLHHGNERPPASLSVLWWEWLWPYANPILHTNLNTVFTPSHFTLATMYE